MKKVTQFSIKYRPDKWENIVGQEKIIKELQKRSVDENYPNVVYLTGLYGTGKDTVQLILLKSMFCQNKDSEGNACNICTACKSIDKGNSSGVHGLEIYNSSDVNIDKARSISESARTCFFGDNKRRVYVFNELQEFNKNKAALRNLLTTFERPIPNVHFVFNSMEYVTLSEKNSKNAIGSRTLTYKFKPISYDLIAGRLEEICMLENIKIDTDEKANVIFLIAEKASGSMRDAMAMLERVIYSNLWTEKDLCEELEIYSDSSISEILNCLFCSKLDILPFTISEDLINDIKYRVMLLMKHKTGFNLNSFEQSKVQNIKIDSVSIKNLILAMEKITEISKLSFFDKNFAMFKLLEIINFPKDEIKEVEIKRRIRHEE